MIIFKRLQIYLIKKLMKFDSECDIIQTVINKNRNNILNTFKIYKKHKIYIILRLIKRRREELKGELKMSKYVFGIDLGTTYSCIARVDDTARAEVIKNNDGKIMMEII